MPVSRARERSLPLVQTRSPGIRASALRLEHGQAGALQCRRHGRQSVTPTGVAGLEFLDEADAINASVRKLRRQGVSTIVVTIHQGIRQTSYEGSTNPAIQNLTGPIVDIVERLDSEVDVVIPGHAHGFTNALIPNAAGKQILVTQAFSASTAYGDIDLSIKARTASSARSISMRWWSTSSR